ncbi:hypothetical protein [Aquincola sp. J276]|uniref:hypothetical protein n=1 Tax=Aquincola sp. J276 TaxID=2898432 RepID=UPI00215120CD|nr:hypothetical protein [Aquincola sp. J276]MCR5867680.1 hypothetical protein [Aquincola sp. J276]
MRASDPSRWPLRMLCAAMALACLLPAAAQDSREREALRRAQAALNDTRRELAALQAERAQLLRDREAAAAQAAAAEQARQALLAQHGRLQQQLAALRSAQEAQAAADAQRHAQATADAAAQATALQQRLAEQQRSNAAVTALLERATQALAASEDRNRQLHALALQAVERYRSKTPTEAALQGDPLLGLTQIRIDNVAEELRTQADALRSAPARR